MPISVRTEAPAGSSRSPRHIRKLYLPSEQTAGFSAREAAPPTERRLPEWRAFSRGIPALVRRDNAAPRRSLNFNLAIFSLQFSDDGRTVHARAIEFRHLHDLNSARGHENAVAFN